MRALVLLVLLAGCAQPEAAAPSIDPPAVLLERCPTRVVPPAAPKPTADRMTFARFGVQAQLAREGTDRALAACTTRHQALVDLLRQMKETQ